MLSSTPRPAASRLPATHRRSLASNALQFFTWFLEELHRSNPFEDLHDAVEWHALAVREVWS